MIPVTKPYIPPLSEYIHLLEGIWERGQLTNNGPLVVALEKDISAYLNCVPNCYVTNGTIAIQLAIQALELKGEIITTPYSYVATTSSILWEHCLPVFVDCLPNGNIDPDLIEKSINKNTSAILATHVYGFPCEVQRIEALAKKYNLKIIYDAAHAFGVKVNDTSLYNFGDISTASFHATKLFHTIEGGAVFCSEPKVMERIKLLRAFGHKGDTHFCLGINGKQSEVHAAMGLVMLPKIPEVIAERKRIYEMYVQQLQARVEFVHPVFPLHVEYNYAYVPVLLPPSSNIEKIVELLKGDNILVRRYFYPSLNTLPYLRNRIHCPVSENLASRALCLPLYNGLTEAEQQTVISSVKKHL